MASNSGAILHEPVNEPDGSTLPRHPTLEARRGPSTATLGLNILIKAFFGIDHIPNDSTKNKLQDAVAKSEGNVRQNMRGLLTGYSLFKNTISTGMWHKLFQCFTITDGFQDGVIKSKIDILQPDTSAAFPKFTQALSLHLSSRHPGGLRVVVLCFEPIIKFKKSFLITSLKVIAIFGGRLPSFSLVPNNVIAFLLGQYLEDEVPTLVHSPTPHMRDAQRRLLFPPSLSAIRGNLDPKQFTDNYIELAWQAEAPTYVSDFSVYIWEQYKSLPRSQRAVLKLYPRTDTRESALLILFQTSQTLELFSKLRGNSRQQGSTSATASTWSTNSEVLLSICAVYRVIICETTIFLQGCSVELKKLHLAARQNPTATKIKYLVHLEDCRSSAYEGMIHGLEVLNSVAKWADTLNSQQPLWDAGKPFEDRLAVLRRDLEFFRKNFRDIEKQVKKLQQTLHDHLELNHNRRNFILAIGAAIYLPLSFATSFFGMNMNSMTPGGPEGFSNWTTFWIMNSPIDSQNSTKALVSSINSSGTLSYPWKTFIITASCLLATLPLSLGIGGVLRVAYRQTIHYASYWRIIAIVPGLPFIFFSIFGLEFIPRFHWSKVLYFLCNSILVLFLFIKTSQQPSSQKDETFWKSMTLFTLLFFILDIFARHAPLMIVPWLCFLLVGVTLWFEKRQQRNTKHTVLNNSV